MARNPLVPAFAVLALFSAVACAHNSGSGTYASFTFRPATPTPEATAPLHPKPTAQTLARWIAVDRAQLRHLKPDSPAYIAYEADLLNALYLARRDAELRRELTFVRRSIPGAAELPGDAMFFRLDPLGGFRAYATDAALHDPLELARAARWNDAIAQLRQVHGDRAVGDDAVRAALLEGDAYFACGSFDAADTSWYRAFSTGVLRGPDHGKFFPEWTSAMDRLVQRYGGSKPSPQPGCRNLLAPVADPMP